MYAVASASAVGDNLSADCVLRDSIMHPVQAWGLTMAAIPPGIILVWYVLFKILRHVSQKKKYLTVYLPVSIIVTLTFAHPVVTKAAVKLLACRTVARKQFLDADFNIRCESNEYKTWMGMVAIPLLVFFTFGVPVAYGLAMYRHVKNKTLEQHRDVYGFFFSGFRKDIWWFELWNTLRKSLFTISSILCAPAGVMMQTWAALVFLLFFLVVFSVSQPYEQEYLNNLERGALSISIITLLCGLGLFTNDQAGEDARSEGFAIFLTFVIMVSNVLFVISVLYTFLKHTTYISCLKQFQDNDTEENTETKDKKQGSHRSVAIVPINKSISFVLKQYQLRQDVHNALNKKIAEKNSLLPPATLPPIEESSTVTRSLPFIKRGMERGKSTRTIAVEKIQRNSTINRDGAVKKIQQRHSRRRSSLHARVEATKVAKRSNALQNCKVFADLDNKSISNIIDRMGFQIVDKGSVICRQGAFADTLFLIMSGKCDVFVTGEKVATLVKFDVFGEKALFPDVNGIAIRGATVKATDDANVHLLCLSKLKFDELIDSGMLNKNSLNKLKAVADKRTKENLVLQLLKGEIKIEASSTIQKPPAIELAGPPATKQDEPPVKVTKIKKPLAIKLAGPPATKKDEPPVKVTELNAIKLAGPPAESLPGLATTTIASTTATTPAPSQSETEEQLGEWSEMFDQTSGYPYWYNNITGISSWENPEPEPQQPIVDKVKKLLKDTIKTSQRLNKIFVRANKNKKENEKDNLGRKRFEMLIDKVLADSEKEQNRQKIKEATWSFVKRKSQLDNKDLIERQVLSEWLFGPDV